MGKLKGPMMIKPCHTFTAALDDSADFTSVVRNFLHKHCTNEPSDSVHNREGSVAIL